MNTEQNYRIGLTTQITGIRPETLRAWERRYEVVKPIRTDAGDRLYSQADIDMLLLINSVMAFEFDQDEILLSMPQVFLLALFD